MTPTSRSISESERSQKKLTIDDLDGKLYEETDEDMVREVVENLADLTELLLLSENVPGHSEPQLVWRKRSNLQNVSEPYNTKILKSRVHIGLDFLLLVNI